MEIIKRKHRLEVKAEVFDELSDAAIKYAQLLNTKGAYDVAGSLEQTMRIEEYYLKLGSNNEAREFINFMDELSVPR